MKKNRVLSILLLLALIFGLLPSLQITAKTIYSDMPNNWSTLALENAVDNGLLMGSDGMIMPKKNVTRAEMAAMVNRSLGSIKLESLAGYTDISTTAWYAADMAKAVHTGIFSGSNGRLSPTKDITREEAFSVLARAIKLTTTNIDSLNKFTDASQVSNWAKNDVAALVLAGFVDGANGRLNPLGKITRAELAQVFDNIIGNYTSADQTVSEIFSGNVIIRDKNVTLKDTTIEGDLIIGGGVGSSNVVLNNTKVNGRIVVRGSDAGTITLLKGTIVTDKIIIENKDNRTNINIEKDVSVIAIDKYTEANITGNIIGIDIQDKTNEPDDTTPGATYVELGGVKITIGEKVASVTAKLGTPNRIDTGLEKYEQYVYNKDYSKYIMVGILDGKVSSIYTSNTNFTLNNNTAFGATNYTKIIDVTYYIDKLDGNKLYGIWVGRDSSTHSGTGYQNMTNKFDLLRTIAETQNLDMLNAFRVKNSLNVLTVDSIAKKTAVAHSRDMANQNYFDHIGLDGRSPFQRYDDNNGLYRSHSENIAAGYYSGVDNFDGWLNSKGHRNGMLNSTSKYVGIGLGYSSDSEYKFYMTQLFSY